MSIRTRGEIFSALVVAILIVLVLLLGQEFLPRIIMDNNGQGELSWGYRGAVVITKTCSRVLTVDFLKDGEILGVLNLGRTGHITIPGVIYLCFYGIEPSSIPQGATSARYYFMYG